jgi:stage II sporulation protein D
VSLYKGKLLVVNHVDIEDYLLSVVPSESIPSWPLETLKAQAVTARTYAYYQILHRRNKPYDLVDDEGDQAYGGVDKEHPKATKAVKLTEGQVLVYRGRPILAMYMANSGGYTADPKAVFNLFKPYLVAHPDPASLKGKMARWKRVFSVEEVEKKFRKFGIKIDGLINIEPAQIGPSGRIIKVKLVTTRGNKVLRTRTTLRRVLKLPDILLYIKKIDNKFIFEGGGFGHGVGYSQWGAAIMGKTHSYLDILSFYYPGTKVEKLW